MEPDTGVDFSESPREQVNRQPTTKNRWTIPTCDEAARFRSDFRIASSELANQHELILEISSQCHHLRTEFTTDALARKSIPEYLGEFTMML